MEARSRKSRSARHARDRGRSYEPTPRARAAPVYSSAPSLASEAIAPVPDTGSHVPVELHRLRHRRLDGNTSKSLRRERSKHLLNQRSELVRAFNELADA